MTRLEHVMGTAISIDIRDGTPCHPDDIVDDTFGWLHWVDETFSTYKPSSQISRLGRGEIPLDGCDPLVREVLERCEDLRQATDGYFDAHAGPGGALDPSGFVKGWAVELASQRLAAAGAVNHCVNAGGDVCLAGTAEPGKPWRVGIVHPLQPSALTVVVALSDGAVATSGLYERGPHVVDPHTGQPATELASVSVIGPSLALADAYATAALAMGAEAPIWLDGLEGYESFVIDAGGHAWWSPGFPAYRVA